MSPLLLIVVMATATTALRNNVTSDGDGGDDLRKYEMVMKEEPTGNSVTLDCLSPSSVGSDAIKYAWTRLVVDEEAEVTGEHFRRTRGGRKLVIEHVTEADAGEYRCVARWRINDGREEGKSERRFTVAVTARRASIRPFIAAHGQLNQSGEQGSNVVFKIKVYTAEELSWSRAPLGSNHFTPLTNDDDDGRVVTRESMMRNGTERRPAENERDASLAITHLVAADAGRYRCEAVNWLGAATITFRLAVTNATATPPHVNHVPADESRHVTWVVVAVAAAVATLAGLNLAYARWRKRGKKHRLYPIRNSDCIPTMETQEDRGPLALSPVLPVHPVGAGYLTGDIRVTFNNHVTGGAPGWRCEAEWEIDRSQIEIEQLLDEGFFGQVYRARVTSLDGSSVVCAVKMLKDSGGQGGKDMIGEFEQMKRVGAHHNIASLLGVCALPRSVWLLIEYAEEGNLRDYLKRHRPGNHYEEPPRHHERHRELTHGDLVSASAQVACGMEFLVTSRCVHRDLAARNVLVTRDFAMKISDFGLARDVHDYYRKKTRGHLPYKWMALEALLENIFTHATDVWSFGVLLWEVFTLGNAPYPGVKTNELVSYLRAGHRLARPDYASPLLYRLMKDCWDATPSNRPSFRQLHEDFRRMIVEPDQHGDAPLRGCTAPAATRGDSWSASSGDEAPISPRTEEENLDVEFFDDDDDDDASDQTILANQALLRDESTF